MLCRIAITTISRELIREAKRYLEATKICKVGFGVPVILSHTALETQASSMERFFLRKEDFNNKEIDKILRNMNISCGGKNQLTKARLLFKIILKENIPNEINLNELDKLNSLRNKVIHRGEIVSRAEAEEAVKIVEKALTLLESMFQKLIRAK